MPWSLSDPVTGDTYQFEIGPEVGQANGEPLYKKKLLLDDCPNGQPNLMLDQADPMQGEIAGTLLSANEYNTLWKWFYKRYPVNLIDDLGRNTSIIFTDIDMKRQWKSDPAAQYYHKWSLKYLVVSLVEV